MNFILCYLPYRSASRQTTENLRQMGDMYCIRMKGIIDFKYYTFRKVIL